MFIDAIEQVSAFTRPIHSIIRTFGSNNVIPGAATLFFVNDEGYAVTCKHVAELLINSENINQKYAAFRVERDKAGDDPSGSQQVASLKLKYDYNPSAIVQVKHIFVDCVDTMSGFTAHLHPKYDLAIIRFNDYRHLRYSGHAIFLKESASVKQGEYLCRLGFPFPEFNNFKFDEKTDDIAWTPEGQSSSPRFPIDGMVTRFLADAQQLYGIELSTAGLRGQSGGPLFNRKGLVCGMQFSTRHLHLGFDIVDKEIIVDNSPRTVSDYSFLHLGQCIHADIIKSFLAEKNVRFFEQ